MAVGAGLPVMGAMMNAGVEAVCGPRGEHDPQRAAVRHGVGDGSVSWGGRRVAVQRPRMRAADGSREMAVTSYQLFSSTEVLGRMAMQRMLAGLSTRQYPAGLEPVGQKVDKVARSTSKSAVSRRFLPRRAVSILTVIFEGQVLRRVLEPARHHCQDSPGSDRWFPTLLIQRPEAGNCTTPRDATSLGLRRRWRPVRSRDPDRCCQWDPDDALRTEPRTAHLRDG